MTYIKKHLAPDADPQISKPDHQNHLSKGVPSIPIALIPELVGDAKTASVNTSERQLARSTRHRRLAESLALATATVPMVIGAGVLAFHDWHRFASAFMDGEATALMIAGLGGTAAAIAMVGGFLVYRASREEDIYEELGDGIRRLDSEQRRSEDILDTIAREMTDQRKTIQNISAVELADDFDAFWGDMTATYYAGGPYMTYDVHDRLSRNGKVELRPTARLYNWARRLADDGLVDMRIVVYLDPDTDPAFRPLSWRPAYKIDYALDAAEEICRREGWESNPNKVRISVIHEPQPALPSFVFGRRLANGEIEEIGVQYLHPPSTQYAFASDHAQQLVIFRGTKCRNLKQRISHEFYRGEQVTRDKFRAILATGRNDRGPEIIDNGDGHMRF